MTIVPLFNPRQQLWSDHFQIDKTTGQLEALTPQGKVTIFLLRLNDPERIADCKLLIEEQRYPCFVKE